MSEAESKQAMKTMKCPRCGGKLYYRDVIDGGISEEFCEIWDIYGHSFFVKIKDFIKAREGRVA